VHDSIGSDTGKINNHWQRARTRSNTLIQKPTKKSFKKQQQKIP
jgi:hypothetical protein